MISQLKQGFLFPKQYLRLSDTANHSTQEFRHSKTPPQVSLFASLDFNLPDRHCNESDPIDYFRRYFRRHSGRIGLLCSSAFGFNWLRV